MISKVVVLGATGLIGGHLMDLLLEDVSIKSITVLTRRMVELKHAKVDVRVVDFDNFDLYRNQFPSGDAIFCCIGTTMDKVKGDKELYKRIDHDIAVNAGRIGMEKGFKHFAIVSSVGANKTSSTFYLKLKGQVEESLSQLHYEGLHVFQPSLLVGIRHESRLGEGVAQTLMPALSFLMIGGLTKYRPIPASSVAAAMLHVVKNEIRGVKRYTYKEINQLA